MSKKSELFLERYKALDGFLREIQKSDYGITDFLDSYEDSNDRKLREVYYQLKHLRWLRNRLANADEENNEEIISDADLDDLRFVSKYFMKDNVTKAEWVIEKREINKEVKTKEIEETKEADQTEETRETKDTTEKIKTVDSTSKLTAIIDEEVAGLDEKDATIIMKTIADDELIIPSDGVANTQNLKLEEYDTRVFGPKDTVTLRKALKSEDTLQLSKQEIDAAKDNAQTKTQAQSKEAAPVNKLLVVALIVALVWLAAIAYLMFIR